MESRKQFTMYESIYKSLQRIRNKKDRADAYDAICAYALYNEEPDLASVSDAVAIAFELTRPVLDSARKKAENGKQGGSKSKANSKQTESKPKQTAREKEEEIEKEDEEENEIEIEKEKESLLSLSAGGGDSARARAASESELLGIGLKPGEFPGVTSECVTEVIEVTERLFARYWPSYYPRSWDFRKTFEHQGHTSRRELLEYAFEQSVIASKAGDWRYIHGIMERLAMRGIETAEQARAWDEARPDLNGEEE